MNIDEYGVRLIATKRDRVVVDTDRDGIARGKSFMQDFDGRTFDQPHFDEPPLQLTSWQRRCDRSLIQAGHLGPDTLAQAAKWLAEQHRSLHRR
ncbi:hypothetical protein TSO5_20430 [Azospirillum sp. TSO5]|nr:hypothetical protein TSO5_20430 [Azospirillum sp. TSO5]